MVSKVVALLMIILLSGFTINKPASTECPLFVAKPNHLTHYSHKKFSNPFIKKTVAETPDSNTLQNSGWYNQALQQIARSEYSFSRSANANGYYTPNRKQNLQFFYSANGFTAEPLKTKASGEANNNQQISLWKNGSNNQSWKIQLKLNEKQMENGTWTVNKNKAEYITENISVQYQNDESGMRQNFIVNKPIQTGEALLMHLAIKTKLKMVLADDRLQFFYKNSNVFNYEKLKVWDANGKILEAQFTKSSSGKIAIRINTTGAVYPITVDPISTTPAAIMESNNAGASLGFSVSSAGDVNGDGYSDVIAGAFFYNNGETGEGAIFVYHGSAAGINTTAATIIESNIPTAFFGRSVSLAGDVNGDGYGDIIVGADGYTNGQVSEGAVFIYHGSATGINAIPAAVIESNLSNSKLGYSVAGAGDVNGDGFSDVIAGAPVYSNGQSNEGAVFVFHGSAAGINTTAAAVLEINQSGAGLGFAVSSAGNINGDAYSDIVAGAWSYSNIEPNEGAIFIFNGSGTGIGTGYSAMVESNHANALFGTSVACAGDVNGDGYSDIIAGAPQYTNGESMEGGVFLFNGSSTGMNTTPATILESNQANALSGNKASVACAGDINGDGYSDVAAGATGYDNGELDEGAVFVYFGSASGINITAAAILESNQAGANMGTVASAGDVNGDGYSDLITGAYNYSNGEVNEGAAFVYQGSAAGLSATPDNIANDADQSSAGFSNSVAAAGDVNGDGYSDMLIGANAFNGTAADEGRVFVYQGSASGLPNTFTYYLDASDQAFAQFGKSVSTAGDVNGDGYSDVVIGANRYDDGFANEGRAYVYYGSVSGLSAAPDRILDDANQANAEFGNSVSCAGDVNGDGFSDVLVGAYFYDVGTNANQGRVYLYHGSATGLSASPATILNSSNQAGSLFGNSVSTAGDVNGDGYSDILIAAYFYTSPTLFEGRVYGFYGSPAGISVTPNITLQGDNQSESYFGTSVASAGDVNADGFCDIIIGVYGYDDGVNVDEGRAYVYYGASAGLNAASVSVLDAANQFDTQFGSSVAGAGDINGDGYSDVVVGAPIYDDGFADEGKAFVFLGSPTGINSTAAFTPADANKPISQFGNSVAGAGDVNGDGFSDLVIGSQLYDDPPFNDEGNAFTYYGNQGTGKNNNPRLYNTDLTTPYNTLAGAGPPDFGIGLFSKNFLGRSMGKLVWETKLNYNAFNGNPVTNSTGFTSAQSIFSDLGTNGIELKTIANKILATHTFTKIRVRTKYDPVTAVTGQVYGPWRYIQENLSGNWLGVLPVELKDFTASWITSGWVSKINFTVDKENAMCCYMVEKSTDALHFQPIATIPAVNSSGLHGYDFADYFAKENKQYYRLRIKDLNGKVQVSNTVLLCNNKPKTIAVYPNPATDFINVDLKDANSKGSWYLMNEAGVILQKGLHTGGSELHINTHTLAKGYYVLQLQIGNAKESIHFVKQ